MVTDQDRDQRWRDDQLMGMTGAAFSGTIPGLRFVVPVVCRPEGEGTGHNTEDEGRTPGIYLTEIMPRSGPVLPPRHSERHLTREQALEYARGYDKLARPKPYEAPGPSRGRLEGYYPPTWEALIEAWYECLTCRLGTAIAKAADRQVQLREVRAALTGRTSEENPDAL